MQLSPILLKIDLQDRFDGPGHAGLLVAIAVADVHDPLPGVTSLETWHWWSERLKRFQVEPTPARARDIWIATCEREQALGFAL